MSDPGAPPTPNVMLTSVGRRVSLLRAFQAAAHARGGRVYAADLDPTAPGLYVADGAALVPGVTAPEYVPRLLELVERWRIGLVVPLIDPELPVLAAAAPELARAGARALIPSEAFVAASWDKLATAELFAAAGVPAPRTRPYRDDLDGWEPPFLIKPRFGSNCAGIARCADREEARFHAARTPEPLIQALLAGDEVTVDVLCDFDGRLLSLVPRRRLKVRGGEVERAATIWDERAAALIERLVVAHRPTGVFNVQYFATEAGPCFTEINARFGGGYPLAHAAGADFPGTLLALLAGERVEPRVGQFERGLHMLRYDAEVFRCGDALLDR